MSNNYSNTLLKSMSRFVRENDLSIDSKKNIQDQTIIQEVLNGIRNLVDRKSSVMLFGSVFDFFNTLLNIIIKATQTITTNEIKIKIITNDIVNTKKNLPFFMENNKLIFRGKTFKISYFNTMKDNLSSLEKDNSLVYYVYNHFLPFIDPALSESVIDILNSKTNHIVIHDDQNNHPFLFGKLLNLNSPKNYNPDIILLSKKIVSDMDIRCIVIGERLSDSYDNKVHISGLQVSLLHGAIKFFHSHFKNPDKITQIETTIKEFTGHSIISNSYIIGFICYIKIVDGFDISKIENQFDHKITNIYQRHNTFVINFKHNLNLDFIRQSFKVIEKNLNLLEKLFYLK